MTIVAPAGDAAVAPDAGCATGAVASGAVASGAVASGAVASGDPDGVGVDVGGAAVLRCAAAAAVGGGSCALLRERAGAATTNFTSGFNRTAVPSVRVHGMGCIDMDQLWKP